MSCVLVWWLDGSLWPWPSAVRERTTRHPPASRALSRLARELLLLLLLLLRGAWGAAARRGAADIASRAAVASRERRRERSSSASPRIAAPRASASCSR